MIIREKSIFTGLHGTGHEFHGVCPNFTGGLVCTGSRFKKNIGTGSGSRTSSRDISLDKNGILNIPRGHGIIPYPVESRGVFTTGKLPRKADNTVMVLFIYSRSTFTFDTQYFILCRIGKNEAHHTSTFWIHVACQFHPSVPVQQQNRLLLPRASGHVDPS